MKIQRQMMRSPQQLPRQWWAAPVACLATLLALPVNAGIVIPDDPLATGIRVAPNVMFILDDSGSMAFDTMPDDVPDTSTPNVALEAYPRNTIYYNPANSYTTWTKADGTKMTGGTSYTAAYGSFNKVGGTTINLGSSTSCQKFNRNTDATNDETSSGTNVCGGVQTFYVPKDTTRTDEAYLGVGTNYYRYQIQSGGSSIIRSEYGAVVTTQDSGSWSNKDSDSGMQQVGSFSVPTGALSLTVSSSGGTHGTNGGVNNNNGNGADLYINRGSLPATNNYDCRSRNGANNESCSITSPTSGTWYVGLQADSRYRNVDVSYTVITDTNSCDGLLSGSGWINCTTALPTARTLGDELINYATWFSYHRTRMKAAKNGASSAFAGMDSRVRVGFRTIWRRSASAFDIPVTDGNDGRFVNNPDDPGVAGDQSTTSRNQWYDKLFGVIGYNGTPLKGALQSVGEYYKKTGTVVGGKDTGPYGPETGTSQYTCRQNYAILTTDGYWNDNDGFTLSSTIANADGTNGVDIGNPSGSPYKYTPAAPFQDSWTASLADVAMYYWKNDLRTENFMGNTSVKAGNNVPSTDDNPAFWQHMVTFGISIGLSGKVDQSSVSEVKANGGPTYNGGTAGWPEPLANNATAIDDLLHAAVNGHGTFIAATNPDAFGTGLKAALSTIYKRTSSFSNVATNSASLRSGAMVFNASYVSGSWTGDIKGYAISAAGGVASTPTWSANFPSWSSRKIYTAGGTFPQGGQTASLGRVGVGLADYEVSGSDNADYIKGKKTLEGSDLGDLRERTTLLGDIVGSSPEFVEDTNTLYVGANDGMLHAFNAANGREQFAYVPAILNMSILRDISRGDYTGSHKFFVDGPIVVSPRALTPSQNILLGTLGRGGKGIFALDVSDPANITATPSLWEKSSASTGYGNLGLVLGKPILAKVKTGVAAAVISNGINSSSDKAVLIIANLATGAKIAEIDTLTGSSATPNGLFEPTGILGVDGSLDYVYAGDLLGNVWKFDLRSATPGAWTATKLFSAKAGGGTGSVQAITGGIGVATDPKTLKRWIFFGTGRFLTASDAADQTANAQGMYGIIDDGAAVSYSDLTQRNLTGTGVTRTADTSATLPAGKKGWYINLPGAGERIVQNAQVVSNVLVTASMLPTGDGCDSSGTGYINALDAFSGTGTGAAFLDSNGDGVVNGSDTVVGSRNFGVGMPTLPVILPGRIVVGGTGGTNGGGDKAPPAPPVRGNTWNRISWREIRQD